MKSYTNVGNPGEKKKSLKEGPVEEGPVTQESLKADRERAKRTKEEIPGKLAQAYDSGPAPRVGGDAPKSTGMAKGTATKKLLKMSKKRARQSDASPAAKKAAIRSLKRKY